MDFTFTRPELTTAGSSKSVSQIACTKAKQANGVTRPIPSFTRTSEAYAHALYSTTIDAQDVGDFLRANNGYDTTQKKWSFPAMPGTTSRHLVGAVYSVLQSIVGRFVLSEGDIVVREVRNTLDIPACTVKNNDGFRACPVLLVRASGPSFQIPEPLGSSTTACSDIGFSNMATYFSVKLETEFRSEKENLDEMASYARRIFHEQPNRIFVRSLIITEKNARLVHFDRAGSQITPPIDIHAYPATFIRLVAGLSSTRERLLGLDDSIQWTIVNGRKTGGTLTTAGPSGETTTYPIVGLMETIRDSFRGRATTCWRVEDTDTREEYVVKDSWRPDNRTAEHEYLELAKGIPGVVQMVSHEDGRVQTKDFRCPSTAEKYHNRTYTRVTMKSYGKPLTFFRSVLQLLGAVRDAIEAHKRLVEDDVGILHRDISHNNILLGKHGAPRGDRGIIIDFDMAFRGTHDRPTARVDYNVGTRVFQSIQVIGSCFRSQTNPAHDYLDDLESFLYLLSYVFLLYRPDGSRFPGSALGPSTVRTWAEENPESAHTHKRQLYGVGAVADRALRFIEEHWGPTCSGLFDSFSWWIFDRRSQKDGFLRESNAASTSDALKPLLSRRNEDYAEVLKMFDDAIDALESAPEDLGAPPSPTEVPPAPAPPRRSARLRDLRHSKGANQPSSSPQVPPPKKSAVPVSVVPSLAPQPRRSDRLRKRRPNDDPSEMVNPGARPMKKRARVALRSR